jgi:hypothetical protein
LPPKKPASAPRIVPIAVATRAAETPTRIDTCAPLIALARTSRPSRSAPKGSVSAFTLAVVLYFFAASSHSL